MNQQSPAAKKALRAVLFLAPITILGSASILMGAANPSLADSNNYNTSTYDNLNYSNPTKWENPKSAYTEQADSKEYNTPTYDNLNYSNPTKWERPSQSDWQENGLEKPTYQEKWFLSLIRNSLELFCKLEEVLRPPFLCFEASLITLKGDYFKCKSPSQWNGLEQAAKEGTGACSVAGLLWQALQSRS